MRVQSAENVIEDLRVIAHAKGRGGCGSRRGRGMAWLPGLLSTIAAHAQSLIWTTTLHSTRAIRASHATPRLNGRPRGLMDDHAASMHHECIS